MPHHLSPRQREIAELIADGFTNQEIGQRLGIHPSTVDNHRRQIYTKLGVDNTAHLTQYALARAWIRNRFAGKGRPPKPRD